MDTSNYNYVNEDDIPKDVICSVCILPLIMPVSHTACGNMFCKNCVAKVTQCPLCRGNVDQNNMVPVTLKFVTNTINNLMVVCPTCNKHVPRCEVEAHVQNDPQPCPIGCSQPVPPKLRDSHALVCPVVIEPCCMLSFGCKWQGKRMDTPSHLEECNFYKMRDWLKHWQELRTIEKEQYEEEIKALKKQIQDLQQQLEQKGSFPKTETIRPVKDPRGFTGCKHINNVTQFVVPPRKIKSANLWYVVAGHSGNDSNGQILMNNNQIGTWKAKGVQPVSINVPIVGNAPFRIDPFTIQIPLQTIQPGQNWVMFRYSSGAHGLSIYDVYLEVSYE